MDVTITMFKIAVQSGEWKGVSDFIDGYYDSAYNLPHFSARITRTGGTILHAAVMAQKESIVEKLVNKMSVNDLAIQDNKGYTALHETTCRGNSRMAECLFTKNNSLVRIRNFSNDLPVVMAMRYGHKQLASYLYGLTPLDDLETEQGHQGSALLTSSIFAKHFDLALSLIDRCPRLAFALPQNLSPLNALAAFQSRTTKLIIWLGCQELWKFHFGCFTHLRQINLENDGFKRLLSRICTEIPGLNPSIDSIIEQAIFYAISKGNFEFVFQMLKANSEFVCIHNSEGMSIFHYAVLHRQAKIFSLAYGLRGRVEALLAERDSFGNTILHLAGMLTEDTSVYSIKSPAFQIHTDMQWFEEVESICQPSVRELLNDEGLSPIQLFRKSHQNLRKEGEKWMKEATNTGLVAATLIVTVVFAAILTFPGGNDGKTGLPIFVNDIRFQWFMGLVSATLFISSTSIVMFLGIFILHNAEEDFFQISFKNLMMGYSCISYSIVTMLIASCIAIALASRRQDSIPDLTIITPIMASVAMLMVTRTLAPLLVGIKGHRSTGEYTFDRNMKPLF